MKVEAQMNTQGLHRVQCPSCQSPRVESFLKFATPEFDPNNKLCRVCGYAWKQIRNESWNHRGAKPQETGDGKN